jgi:hypothetical protein
MPEHETVLVKPQSARITNTLCGPAVQTNSIMAP